MNDGRPPPDHVVEDEADELESSETGFQENVKSKSTWLRLLFMILFLALWSLSRIVVLAVIIVQFFWVLVSGETNTRLLTFGKSLATYSLQIILYLTYNTETQPFPFADWPSEAVTGNDS